MVEAMAAAKPVICLSGGEPATEVTQETGICVELGSPEKTKVGLAQALDTLSSNHDLSVEMGRAGRTRAESYIWNNRLKKLLNIYDDVLQM